MTALEAERDNIRASWMAPNQNWSSVDLGDLHTLQSFSLQVHDFKFTVRLDEEEHIWVRAAPLDIGHVGLELRLELDLFSVDVPDDEDFITSRLGYVVCIVGTPADSSDVFVRKCQQFAQLKCLLVIDVNC